MLCLFVCLHVSLKKNILVCKHRFCREKTKFFLANVDVLAKMGMVFLSLERFHVHFEFIFLVLLASPSKALDVPSMTGLLACRGCLGSDALGKCLGYAEYKRGGNNRSYKKTELFSCCESFWHIPAFAVIKMIQRSIITNQWQSSWHKGVDSYGFKT